ncbi:MAG: SGNH/GDSL hydrolase family protein [Burkholderiales bacterium]|nr:SGNH/GDSL hydrolase family protein [Burkholderiales bacterium]
MNDKSWRQMLGALILLVWFGVGSAHAIPYSMLVVFGDSLADSGNNAVLVDTGQIPGFEPGARTDVPVSGNTFIPTAPYASGRYSNGPVWTEQLAAALGLSASASLLGGTNFAFGGALVGPGGQVPSLLDQVGMFLSGSGGVAAGDALYVVQGGGNDARRALAAAAMGDDPAPFIAGYAANVGTLLDTLIASGARNLLLATVPDIGLLPAVQALGAPAAGLASLLAAQMNLALMAQLAALTSVPGLDIDILDLYGAVNAVFADPASFGLSDVTNACAADPACIADPSGTLYWDGLHVTSTAAGLLAGAALAAITEIPEPASLVLLLAVLLAWRMQRRSWR